MNEKNISLWIGTFKDKNIMKEYFTVGHSKDGDRVNSLFEDAFLLKDVNDYFREIAFYDDIKKSIELLIKGCSYEEQVIPKFMANVKGAEDYEGNTVALLYNYKFNGSKVLDEGGGYSIMYIGTVSYDQD
ncbi:hypothetical protein SH1V18_45450 [Vallitalea longa]|uniref:Uncharacterized protein n=1 Tax=Vallitalea longa TaxID=2936439 RepID=A0A9W5YDG1_9FIRM|nr:immunity 22 family protein [Vallitalea longa]GKX32065.1 hypothetical protein SH1V18_45450 [Vallitalea longa]